MSMTHYVQQLIFSPDLSEVLVLIKCKGPRHLIGKINGQGGVIEAGETARQAAQRESAEESAMQLPLEAFHEVEKVEYPNATMTVFAAIGDLSQAKRLESEPVFSMDIETIRKIAEINPHAVAEDFIGSKDKPGFLDKALAVLVAVEPEAVRKIRESRKERIAAMPSLMNSK